MKLFKKPLPWPSISLGQTKITEDYHPSDKLVLAARGFSFTVCYEDGLPKAYRVILTDGSEKEIDVFDIDGVVEIDEKKRTFVSGTLSLKVDPVSIRAIKDTCIGRDDFTLKIVGLIQEAIDNKDSELVFICNDNSPEKDKFYHDLKVIDAYGFEVKSPVRVAEDDELHGCSKVVFRDDKTYKTFYLSLGGYLAIKPNTSIYNNPDTRFIYYEKCFKTAKVIDVEQVWSYVFKSGVCQRTRLWLHDGISPNYTGRYVVPTRVSDTVPVGGTIFYKDLLGAVLVIYDVEKSKEEKSIAVNRCVNCGSKTRYIGEGGFACIKGCEDVLMAQMEVIFQMTGLYPSANAEEIAAYKESHINADLVDMIKDLWDKNYEYVNALKGMGQLWYVFLLQLSYSNRIGEYLSYSKLFDYIENNPDKFEQILLQPEKLKAFGHPELLGDLSVHPDSLNGFIKLKNLKLI